MAVSRAVKIFGIDQMLFVHSILSFDESKHLLSCPVSDRVADRIRRIPAWDTRQHSGWLGVNIMTQCMGHDMRSFRPVSTGTLLFVQSWHSWPDLGREWAEWLISHEKPHESSCARNTRTDVVMGLPRMLVFHVVSLLHALLPWQLPSLSLARTRLFRCSSCCSALNVDGGLFRGLR